MVLEIVISSIGLTNIINSSYVFSGVRRILSFSPILARFIKCPVCVGFWVGLVLYSVEHGLCFKSFLYGCIGSVSSYTWYLLTKSLVDRFD